MAMLIDVLGQQVAPLIALGTLAATKEAVEATLIAHVTIQSGLYRVDTSAAWTLEHSPSYTCTHTTFTSTKH